MAFVLSKLLWACVSPGSLLAFLLAVGLVLSRTSRPALVKIGKRLSVFVCLCFLAIATLPVGEWALAPLENRFTMDLPEQIDGIIVIGGDEMTAVSQARGMPVALDSVRRYVTFGGMARRYPDAKLVFSGGSGYLHPHTRMLDSEVARAMMTDIGVPTDRLLIEKASRNTYENAVMTADIVRPDPAQKWLLVTSAWHMPRAMGCFRKAGWNITAAPTGYFTTGRYRFYVSFNFVDQLHDLTLATHEYVGLLSYWLMGRTSALWPK